MSSDEYDSDDQLISTRSRRTPARQKHSERVKQRISYKEAVSDNDDDMYLEEIDTSNAPPDRSNEFTIDRVLDHIDCGVNVEPDFGTGYAHEYTFIDTKELWDGERGDLTTDEIFAKINSDPRAGPMTRKYLIKWVDSSYVHNSWNTLEELTEWQVGGIKKIRNYQVKVADVDLDALTYDERETFSLNREMAREAVQEGLHVDRIIDERSVHPHDLQEILFQYMNRRGGGLGPDVEYVPETDANEDIWPLQLLVKWQGLGYDELTWETMDVATKEPYSSAEIFTNYKERGKLYYTGLDPIERYIPITTESFAVVDDKNMTDTTAFLTGTKLRGYQLEGLNWLASNWSKNINGILADEMGLGKTVQCVTFLSHLAHNHHVPGPFLVVVPLSTIYNWYREFAKWAPDLNVLMYIGNNTSRENLCKYEFYIDDATTRRARYKVPKFNVLLTTYEFIIKDKAVLNQFGWQYLMIDEAHRLKDHTSQLYRTLQDFSTRSILLVTGTPLQNNIRELWCLLNFLHPKRFGSVEEFEAAYGGIQDQTQVSTLHHVLQPHLLRRVKKQVLKNMPGKSERIVRVDLSLPQKRLYRYILTQNAKELVKGTKSGKVSLTNIIMELKKCCNHPYLFEDMDIETNAEAIQANNWQYKNMTWVITPPEGSHMPTIVTPEQNRMTICEMVRKSSKLALLDRMLVRLYNSGNRVLIFSQMVKLLDVLADYMVKRGFMFLRLDGTVRANDRQIAMDKYNAPDSKYFTFLLSTRAGGLGINLATADTVIIYDSDWNPQNDLQAEARAHRLGQKNTVCIYRLVSKDTVEERILEKAKRKMILDHVIIQRMDSSSSRVNTNTNQLFDVNDLNKILQFGAEGLFRDTDAANSIAQSGSAGSGANNTDQSSGDATVNASNTSTNSITNANESVLANGILPSLDGSLMSSVSDEDLEVLLYRPTQEELMANQPDEGEDETDAFLSTFQVADLSKSAQTTHITATLEDDDDDDQDDPDLWSRLLDVDADELAMEDVVDGPRTRTTVHYGEQSAAQEELVFKKYGVRVRDIHRLIRSLIYASDINKCMEFIQINNTLSKLPNTNLITIPELLKTIILACKKQMQGAYDTPKEIYEFISGKEKYYINWEGIDILASDIILRLKEMQLFTHVIENELLHADLTYNNSKVTSVLSTQMVPKDDPPSTTGTANTSKDSKSKMITKYAKIQQFFDIVDLYTPDNINTPVTPELHTFASQAQTDAAPDTPFPLKYMYMRVKSKAKVPKRFTDLMNWSHQDDMMLLAGVYLYGPANIHKIIHDPRLGLKEKIIVKKTTQEEHEEKDKDKDTQAEEKEQAKVEENKDSSSSTTVTETPAQAEDAQKQEVKTETTATTNNNTPATTATTVSDSTSSTPTTESTHDSTVTTTTDVKMEDTTTTTTTAPASVADSTPVTTGDVKMEDTTVPSNDTTTTTTTTTDNTTTNPTATSEPATDVKMEDTTTTDKPDTSAESTTTTTTTTSTPATEQKPQQQVVEEDEDDEPVTSVDDDGYVTILRPSEKQLVKNQALVTRIYTLIRSMFIEHAKQCETKHDGDVKRKEKEAAARAKKQAANELKKKAAAAAAGEDGTNTTTTDDSGAKKEPKKRKTATTTNPDGTEKTPKKRKPAAAKTEDAEGKTKDGSGAAAAAAKPKKEKAPPKEKAPAKEKPVKEKSAKSKSTSGTAASGTAAASSSTPVAVVPTHFEFNGVKYELDDALYGKCKKDADAKEGIEQAFDTFFSISRGDGWVTPENQARGTPCILLVGNTIEELTKASTEKDAALAKYEAHLWHYCARLSGQRPDTLQKIYNSLKKAPPKPQ